MLVDRVTAGFGWREAGESNPGTPILLLHGLMGSRRSWEPQLAALGLRRRVLAWDAPGYGSSLPLGGEVGFDVLADAVSCLLDAIGAARAHLVGLSFGGMIAQHVAIRHPARVASLALLASSPKFGLDGTDPVEWQLARLAALDAGEQPVDLAPRVLRAIGGPGLSAAALEGQIDAAALVSAEALRTSVRVLVTHDSRPMLGRIEAPTVVAVGELDGETPVAYARLLASSIPGAALHVVPGAGHLLNVEAPEVVNDLIELHVLHAER